MTDCDLIADRMPAVAHGRASWSPSEAAHLASCASCARGWELVGAALAIGAQEAAGLDPARLAGQVQMRLANPDPAESNPRAALRTWWLTGLAAAAAVVLMVWPRGPGSTAPGAAPGPASVVSVLHELDGLTPTELESLLEVLPAAAGSTQHVDQGGYRDLDTRDLERMLHSLEG